MVNKSTVLLAIVAATLALGACGKKDGVTQTPEQAKAEKDAAAKAVRENPVYGDQFKSMDKAKAVTDDASKKAEEALKKAD
jgi:hypothetical protein